MIDWIHAFDGLLLVDPETGESMDMGDALREQADSIDADAEALFVPIAERIIFLSEKLIEAQNGWTHPGDVPIDTGVSTPDFFLAVVPVIDGVPAHVYSVESPEDAVACAEKLNDGMSPGTAYVLPVIQWTK